MTFISIILLLLITMLLLRSITTIIHELGHGIAALLLTDKKVVLYIAQSGHWRGKVLRFKMGRLSGTVHFNPIPLSYGGWWVGEPRITVKQLRIITWAGPLTAVLVGSITLFLALLLSTTSVIQLLAMLFFVNCLLDFFMSMYGRGFPGTYLNGTPIFDDGKFLKILDQIGDLDKKYAEAVQLFLEDKLEEAKVQFELLALCLYSSYNALGHLILIAHRSSDTEQTGILSEELKQYYKEDINPGYTLAYFYAINDRLEDALKYFSIEVEHEPENSTFRTNRGYTHLLLRHCEAAIEDFDVVIRMGGDDLAYSYANRGLAKWYLGQEQEALTDLEMALNINPKEGYAQKNMGIFLLEKGEPAKALPFLEKAAEVAPPVHGLDQYLETARQALSTN